MDWFGKTQHLIRARRKGMFFRTVFDTLAENGMFNSKIIEGRQLASLIELMNKKNIEKCM